MTNPLLSYYHKGTLKGWIFEISRGVLIAAIPEEPKYCYGICVLGARNERQSRDFSNCQTTYRVIVKGVLKENWSVWLNGEIIDLANDALQTSITVAIPDQAALRGFLNKLWDLNLTLLSVSQIEGSIKEANDDC